TFGAYTVGSAGYYDAFVAKLGPTGTWQWVNQCGGSMADRAYSLALDSQGNAYIAGHFLSPTLIAGTTKLTNAIANRLELFVAKLDAQSNWQWAVQATGSGNGGTGGTSGGSNLAFSIALDGPGRVWLAGYFEGASAQFGSNTLTGAPFTSTSYVARLGNQVLATQPSGVAGSAFTLAPNPSRGTVRVHGLAAGQTVQLYDAMGRLLITQRAPATGTLLLAPPMALAPGLYLVQSGGQMRRLVID
nr:hypothetical protein [Tanacetum cinerariifolium]